MPDSDVTLGVVACLALLASMLISTLGLDPAAADALPVLHHHNQRSDGQRIYSVADRVQTHGPRARAALAPFFKQAQVAYPPSALTLVVLKQERRIEVYAADHVRSERFIRSYPILAASGTLGPKLRQGDKQVPEGLYSIESLNPNSQYHLSLRINYPSEDDVLRAREEARTNLGGDIMIHGSHVSAGCVALGDAAIGELFVLAADAKLPQIEVVFSPVDFRARDGSFDFAGERPSWLVKRYQLIRKRLLALRQE